jgi:glucose dehydrogenase
MTYVSPKTGKQYIIINAGGARQSPDRGDYIIAYALPTITDRHKQKGPSGPFF